MKNTTARWLAGCVVASFVWVPARAQDPVRAQDAAQDAATEAAAQLPDGVQRAVVPHASEDGLEVELFWVEPEGEGPWPTILFVHGHQFGSRPGARLYVDRGYLTASAEQGLLAAAVSQPGYGASDGPSDFCGPRSQAAVATALAHLRGMEQVRPDRIVLSGFSRGAMVASMVATRDTELCGVILGGGSYDLVERFETMGAGPSDAGIKANIVKEAGTTEAAFRARSALLADPPIRVPTLILHGEEDTNCPVDQALELADRLNAAGTPVTLATFPGVEHSIPGELTRPYKDEFLKKTAFAPDEE